VFFLGFDGHGVDGVGLAYHEARGQALGNGLVKQVLKHGGWKELAGAADGRVPGQVLVYFVA
jgi:hypothetical protein